MYTLLGTSPISRVLSSGEATPHAAELAFHLGLEPTTTEAFVPERSLDELEACLCLLHPDIRQTFYTAFCARYIPQLVDAFISLPSGKYPLDTTSMFFNRYSDLLCSFSDNIYFAKYMVSQRACAANGKLLAAYLTARLHSALNEQIYFNHDYVVNMVNNAIKLLQKALYIGIADNETRPEVLRLSPEAKKKTLDMLNRWFEYLKCTTSLSSEDSGRFQQLILLVEGNNMATDLAWYVGHVSLNVHSCSRSGCRELRRVGFLCSRCETVGYCSDEHQSEDRIDFDPVRNHWSWCHVTTY